MAAGKSRQAVIAVAAGAALVLAGLGITCSAYLHDQPNENVRGIIVVGDAPFRGRVAEALARISADTVADRLVRAEIREIRQGVRSGVEPDQHPAVITLSDRTAQHSLSWCATCIVHEAAHVRRGPATDSGFIAAERECLAVAADYLRRTGGPAGEIDWLAKQDGSHSDLDGDGDFDLDDYRQRSW